MSEVVVQRSRTGWDAVLGILLIVGAFVVLGNAVLATVVSVFFLGWSAVISGAVLLIGALFKLREGGAVWVAIGGAVLLVFGIAVLRNPVIAVVTLTLMMGMVFLVGGIARLVAAFSAPGYRLLLIISGLAALALGLFVFFNPLAASLQLLGIMLGIEILIDGLTLLVAGRPRVVEPAAV